MRELLRKNAGFFIIFAIVALLVRLFFLWKFRFVAGDSLIYGDIAKNWMQHGTYAVTDDGVPVPTLIRLPGYPAFLVAVWSIVGVEHYTAPMVAQILVDLATCFVTAELARETVSDRAARIAFAFSACCIFLANYDVTPLTEPLATFFAALALLAAVKGLRTLHARRWLGWWFLCGVATGTGISLRPDGGILLVAIGMYLLAFIARQGSPRRVITAGLIVAVISLAPLAPWTIRNYRTLRVWQPLAPRFANNPDEYAPTGFYRWVRTWIVDYISVEDLYWHMPGEQLDMNFLPRRAMDSPEQRQRTSDLFSRYNESLRMTPELDEQFRELADQRIEAHPARYYVWLPALRVADMWLRPRTEALPLDSRWWQFREDPRDAAIGSALGLVNLAAILLAVVVVIRGEVRFAGVMLLWIVLRSAFLATLENPEPRYVLECYPAVLVFAAAAFKGSQDDPPQARPS